MSSASENIVSKRPSDAWLQSDAAKHIQSIRRKFQHPKIKTKPASKEITTYAPNCLVTGKIIGVKKGTKRVHMQDFPRETDAFKLRKKYKRKVKFDKKLFDFPTLTEILLNVSDKYGFTINELSSRRKRSEYMPARFEYAFLAKRDTAASFPEMGKFLGDRDHTTMIYSIRGYIEFQKMKAGIIPISKRYKDLDFDLIIDGNFS